MTSVVEQPEQKESEETSMNSQSEQKIFYTLNGKRQPPETLAQLKALAIKGDFQRSDKYWRQGMDKWELAESLAEVFEDLFPLLDEVGVEYPLPPELDQKAIDHKSELISSEDFPVDPQDAVSGKANLKTAKMDCREAADVIEKDDSATSAAKLNAQVHTN